MSKKSVAIFDIECDSLLEKVSQVWVLVVQDYYTKEQKLFTDQKVNDYTVHGTLEEGVKLLLSYDIKVCHNCVSFDWLVLNKFYPDLWNLETAPLSSMWDTLVQSRCQMYDRPKIKGTKSHHGLEYYGLLFKYPKPPIEDWTYFSEDKLNRCLVDVEINRKTFVYLNNEAKKIGLNFRKQIERTKMASYWYALQELHGTKGDVEYMEECVKELDNILEELREEIEPRLPIQLKVKSAKCTWEDISKKWSAFYQKVPSAKFDSDGRVIKEAWMPTTKVFLKNGNYDKHTAAWFDIEPESAKSDRLVVGAYTKVYFEGAKMSQHAIVKDYLLSIGWRPTQWNYEKDKDGKLVRDDRGQLIKKSPKLTEDSFDSIEGELGRKIANYNTYTHRRRTFMNEKNDEKGWINQIRPDGRISSGCMAFATSTGRASQVNLVNVPSASALYGSQMRRSWVSGEGNVLISVDMDSAQLRLLANFMGDPLYTDAVLNGTEFDENHNYIGTDVHSRNGVAFGVLPESLIERARETQDHKIIQQCSDIRKYSKNSIYAFLFGAGDQKFAQTLKLKSAAEGKAIKETFTANLPAIGSLQKRLLDQYHSYKYGKGGFIQVAGGTWLYCTSEHKLLNYLLMGSEAALQNEAINWVNSEMKERNLQGSQILSFHDELTFEFPEEEKEEGIKLLSEMYGEASKCIGLDVLVTGTAQAGQTWLDIH